MRLQSILCAAIGVCAVCLTSWAHAMQSPGANEVGSDGNPGGRPTPSERLAGQGAIIIQWSERLDEISGFSKKTGRWQKLKVDPQLTIQPQCDELVGAVRLKNGMAAFSGETGTWDVVHLPEDSSTVLEVGPDLAYLKVGEHFYTFSASTGRWTSPTDTALEPIAIVRPGSYNLGGGQLYLKLMDWLQTIPANEVDGTIQYSEGVLTLLPRTEAWRERVEAEINRLSTIAAAAYQRQPSPQQFTDVLREGGGSGMPAGVPDSGGNPRQILDRELMITWSESNDELRGYSHSLGDWEILKVEKQQQLTPIVSGKVAAVRLRDSIAAYSSVNGWWDVLPMTDENPSQPVLNEDLVKIEDHGHLYTFSAAKGRWTSPTDPEHQAVTREVVLGHRIDNRNFRSDVDAWFASLPKHDARSVSVMFHWNTLGLIATIHGDRLQMLNELEAKIKEFIVRTVVETTHAERGSLSGNRSPQTPTGSNLDLESEPRLAKLREELQQLEQSVISTSGEQYDETRRNAELRRLVENAFDTRQQLQELEAQQMRLKLQRIEQSLEARQKARKSIIDRRLEQLQSLEKQKDIKAR